VSSGKTPPHPINDLPRLRQLTSCRSPDKPLRRFVIRRNAMYHFTFIDEASAENEQKSSNLQKKALEQANEKSDPKNSLIQKTSDFLHRYLDQPNCVRIFINKN
jgi:hypothetical protein